MPKSIRKKVEVAAERAKAALPGWSKKVRASQVGSWHRWLRNDDAELPFIAACTLVATADMQPGRVPEKFVGNPTPRKRCQICVGVPVEVKEVIVKESPPSVRGRPFTRLEQAEKYARLTGVGVVHHIIYPGADSHLESGVWVVEAGAM